MTHHPTPSPGLRPACSGVRVGGVTRCGGWLEPHSCHLSPTCEPVAEITIRSDAAGLEAEIQRPLAFPALHAHLTSGWRNKYWRVKLGTPCYQTAGNKAHSFRGLVHSAPCVRRVRLLLTPGAAWTPYRESGGGNQPALVLFSRAECGRFGSTQYAGARSDRGSAGARWRSGPVGHSGVDHRRPPPAAFSTASAF